MAPPPLRFPLRTKSFLLLAVISLFARIACSDSSESTTSQLISKANSLLASGQAAKALELYEIALERDPDDYLTLYKKATTQMSLGQNQHASQSFQKVLSLKDFDRARVQLAKIHLKSGELEACQTELETYFENHPKSTSESDAKSIQTDLQAAQKHLKSARAHLKSKTYSKCVDEASAVIQIASQSSSFRQLRADCHLMQAHIQEAAGDLTRVTHLAPNDRLAGLRLSFLSYFLLEQPLEQAIKPTKQCLHSDPESKPCKKMFKLLKSLDKELAKVRNFSNSNGHRSAIKILFPKTNEAEGLIESVKLTIRQSQEPDLKSGLTEPLISPDVAELENKSKLLTLLYSFTCKAYIGLNDLKLGQPICEVLYGRDKEDPWGIIGRAEALMAQEEWDQAVNLLRDAYSKDEDNEEIANRLRKAQKGLKVSKQKDYYKVLGVPRNVDQKTLKKAYRKATLKAHPDKGGSQAKMTALNEAYEVLSNPELRARYDNGDDPNDPTSGGGNPFQGFQGNHPIFQQFFQQASSGGGSPFGSGSQFSSSGQTFSFRFG